MEKLYEHKLCELYSIHSGISSAKDQAGHGYPFLSFKTVFDNYFIPKELPDLMDCCEKDLEQYSVKRGDLFLTRTSETVDELAMSSVALQDQEKATFSGFLKRLRPKQEKKICPEFAGFYFRSPYFRRLINNYTTLTTRASFNEDIFSFLKVYLPEYHSQEKIGHTLYLIEQKIENNNCINDNLQQVIKSCFDFMFGTRKPNGIISDILQERPKSTIQVNDSTGVFGDYPFFTSGEAINEWQSALVDGMNCYLSTGGNATIKGYYGKAAYSTDTWCVCGKGEYSFYLFCYLKSIIRSINDSFFAGSGLKHLQKDSLLLVNLYIPSEKELEKFNSIVKPAMETMTKLFLETKKLKQQRDFLLPLLMNGQATIAE